MLPRRNRRPSFVSTLTTRLDGFATGVSPAATVDTTFDTGLAAKACVDAVLAHIEPLDPGALP